MKDETMIKEQIKIYQEQLHKHMKTCEVKDCHTEKKIQIWINALKWTLRD